MLLIGMISFTAMASTPLTEQKQKIEIVKDFQVQAIADNVLSFELVSVDTGANFLQSNEAHIFKNVTELFNTLAIITDVGRYSSKHYFNLNKTKIMLIPIETKLDFGQAIEALKQGKKISRADWSRKGIFVFMQVPSTINREIVPKMQSLPQSVKDEFERRFNDPNEQVDAIYYDNQLALVNASNLITGWSPSTLDALADDWCIV